MHGVAQCRYSVEEESGGANDELVWLTNTQEEPVNRY